MTAITTRLLAAVTVALVLAGCRAKQPVVAKQDPIVGKWEAPTSNNTRLVWVFQADGTFRYDLSDVEAQLKARLGPRPLSARAQQILARERAKRFTWRRQDAGYRLDATDFRPTAQGRFMLARVEGAQMTLISPDGGLPDRTLTRVR
jgi:hypothetical protein